MSGKGFPTKTLSAQRKILCGLCVFVGHIDKLILPFFLSTSLILLSSCDRFKKNSSHEKVPDSNIAKGKVLAATYCHSCHMLPDPALLDAKSRDNRVYIFMNDGSNHFKQEYFFPLHGCFKAMAGDFDGDGDLDIAAISFFADYTHHPEESFVYLENKGDLGFQPYRIPGTTSGRYLTMDAADLDGDRKTDLVLGNFSVAPGFLKATAYWKDGPPFIVLKNIIKK